MPDKKDYYEVLGVSKDASKKDIKALDKQLTDACSVFKGTWKG